MCTHYSIQNYSLHLYENTPHDLATDNGGRYTVDVTTLAALAAPSDGRLLTPPGMITANPTAKVGQKVRSDASNAQCVFKVCERKRLRLL